MNVPIQGATMVISRNHAPGYMAERFESLSETYSGSGRIKRVDLINTSPAYLGQTGAETTFLTRCFYLERISGFCESPSDD